MWLRIHSKGAHGRTYIRVVQYCDMVWEAYLPIVLFNNNVPVCSKPSTSNLYRQGGSQRGNSVQKSYFIYLRDNIECEN